MSLEVLLPPGITVRSGARDTFPVTLFYERNYSLKSGLFGTDPKSREGSGSTQKDDLFGVQDGLRLPVPEDF